MELNNLEQQINQRADKATALVAGMPRWRLIVYTLLILFGIIYLVWSYLHRGQTQNTAVFQPMKPAVSTPKVSGPTVQLQVIPDVKLPGYTLPPGHVVIDTAKVPPSPNGGTTVTQVDPQSGASSTEFKPDPAPWFVFENNNTAGLTAEIGTSGARAAAYYKRDILRIKDVHLVTQITAKIPIDSGSKPEFAAAAGLEYRW